MLQNILFYLKILFFFFKAFWLNGQTRMDLGVNLYGKGKSKQIKTILWYENLTKLHYK